MANASPQPNAETVICHYRVRADAEDQFRELLSRHWPTLRRLDAVTDEPAVIYRGQDDQSRLFIYEIFHWQSAEAFQKAHAHPEVVAIWEPMAQLCESREGQPAMWFPHVERLQLN